MEEVEQGRLERIGGKSVEIKVTREEAERIEEGGGVKEGQKRTEAHIIVEGLRCEKKPRVVITGIGKSVERAWEWVEEKRSNKNAKNITKEEMLMKRPVEDSGEKRPVERGGKGEGKGGRQREEENIPKGKGEGEGKGESKGGRQREEEKREEHKRERMEKTKEGLKGQEEVMVWKGEVNAFGAYDEELRVIWNGEREEGRMELWKWMKIGGRLAAEWTVGKDARASRERLRGEDKTQLGTAKSPCSPCYRQGMSQTKKEYWALKEALEVVESKMAEAKEGIEMREPPGLER